MCLVASYTEIEKINQVKKVLNLLTLPVDTEEKKKNLLYNLSYMNNMVVKGYMKERTEADGVIYSTKNYALKRVAELMPDRCFCCLGVLYVYAGGRQYSYHYRGEAPIDRHQAIEWNGVTDGFSYSDEEYKRLTAEVKAGKDAERAQNEADYQKRVHDVKMLVVKAVNEARTGKALVEQFKQAMENHLTKVQKKSKAYQSKDIRRCWDLWAKKLGFNSHYPTTYVSLWRVSSSDMYIAKEFLGRMEKLNIIKL